MKLIEIVSARRSGHHAVMSWVIENLTGIRIDNWDHRLTVVANSGMAAINEGNTENDWVLHLLSQLKSPVKSVLINYEDTKVDYSLFTKSRQYQGKFNFEKILDRDVIDSHRFLVIRDFYNCISSRYHANITNHFPHTYDLGFIELWKNHARAVLNENVHYIKFEDWLISPEKRNEFMKDTFGAFDVVKDLSKVNGTTSSFNERKNVLKRSDMVNLPNDIKELIRKDSELHYLIGALGYEYKQI